MQILLDTADLNSIKRTISYFPIDGVTTNPTIIAKEKTDFIELLKNIRAIIGEDRMLHAQALGTNADAIIEEAKFLNQVIGGNFYIKIPVIAEGIKAMQQIRKIGIKITATAIFTPQQALMAAKAGAEFVAPYVNRLDNISADGIGIVSEICEILQRYSMNTKVLAASFKTVEQVHKASLVGTHAITATEEIVNQLIYHPLTDWSVEQFIADWESVYGAGKLSNSVYGAGKLSNNV